MKFKFLSLSFILGILSLSGFAQGNPPEYLTLPIPSGDVEYTPPIHFAYKGSVILPDTLHQGEGAETSGPGSGSTISRLLTLTNSKVGIGTVAPQARFHVTGGDGLISGRFAVGSSETNFYGLSKLKLLLGDLWTFSDMSSAKIMGYNSLFIENGPPGRRVNGCAAAIKMNTNGSIQLGTAPSGTTDQDLVFNYLTMLSNGRVGIGITNPAKTLHVEGDSYVSGDVGIGKTNPQYKLDVNGDAASDNLHTNNIYFHGSDMKIAYIGQGTLPSKEGDGTEEESEEDTGGRDVGSPDGTYTTDIITINRIGMVGIGGTSPKITLHTDGIINAYHLTLAEKGKMKNLEVTNRLGIGTADPKVSMQIGNIWTFYDGSTNKIIGRNTYWNGSNFVRMQQGYASQITFDNNGNLMFHTAPTGNAGSIVSAWNTVAVKNNGSVGIGTTDTGNYKLKVDGVINCTEVVVTAGGQLDKGDEWPDYVFADDYNLRSLDEVASYIEQHQRLPEIPSAADVAEKGVSLLEINTLLLKKVEELTLYIIDLQNQVDELKKR
ncbi:MAG: hypothetical protein FWG84_07415 [Bacteroidales bacterium]|nr:hypothetical protein [Bacteroidales bacterium]